MKVPPLNLNPDINRVGMAALAPFSPDLLWRYPISLPQSATAPPSSPLLDVKTQMPTHLAPDPRMWSREDVSTFLKWFEREFELPVIDISKFCMNGKALCMLNKSDLADRAPGAGDILHNTLQFLLRDAPQVPQSPLTPHHPLLSPSPLTPTSQGWTLTNPDFHSIGHLLQPGGSVTLSPAPSEQSGGSPRHPENGTSSTGYHHSSSASTGSGHSGGHSDSEDSSRDDSSPQRSPLPPHSSASTFSAQALVSLKHLTDYQRAAAAAAACAAAAVQNSAHEEASHIQHHPQPISQVQSLHQQHQPSISQPPAPPLPGDEPVETGTNGRLLWDFLQQLLNDAQQRYSRYIAWKNRETGVFKIVDPPGLARLWGIQKNHLSMNYDKMSRALRYYYRVNILRKVQGERHCYQFLRNPSELKSIKNISLLRGAPLPSPHKREPQNISTPMEEDEGPTDLSMASLVHQYPSYQQQQHIEGKSHSIAPTESNFQSSNRMDTKPQNLTVERQLEAPMKTEEYTDESFK